MADLTKEDAIKILENIDARGKARDEKGQFIAQEQVDAAREIVAKDLQSHKGTMGAFKNLMKIQNDTKQRLEAKLESQTTAIKNQEKAVNEEKAELKLLEEKNAEERTEAENERIGELKKIVKANDKIVTEQEAARQTLTEQINPLLKDNRLLKERKEDLGKMRKELEDQGLRAEDDKAFQEEQRQIALDEIEIQRKGNIPLSKKLELEKDKAKIQSKSDNILTKGFGGLKLGLVGLAEKFGKGALVVGKTLLTLFGIGLLIKFLESDIWKRVREFLKSGSWEDFKEIFMPGGSFDGIGTAIITVIGLATAGLAGLTFKMLGGPLLVSAFKGLFGLASKALGALGIPGLKKGPDGGEGDLTGDQKKQADDLKKENQKKPKKKGWMSRVLGSAKQLGGAAIEKGTELAKKTVEGGKKLGKDALTAAKAAVPKIAGASKAALKTAAAAGKFIPGAGLVIGAGVAAVEGVMAGVEEFKESGDAGRAVAEGFGGAISSLTFGLVDKEKFADIFKKPAGAEGPGSEPVLAKMDMSGDSDAARLRRLQDSLKDEKLTETMRQHRLDKMKDLERKLARQSAGGGGNTVVSQDNSSNQNVTQNRQENIMLTDNDMAGAVAAGPA